MGTLIKGEPDNCEIDSTALREDEPQSECARVTDEDRQGSMNVYGKQAWRVRERCVQHRSERKTTNTKRMRTVNQQKREQKPGAWGGDANT